MKQKDLKIDFRYLTGNIACLSVDSISGESVHNDINNEEAIIIFNSLVGEKENCQTVKTLLEENIELKKQLEERKYYKFYKYENNPDGSDYCFCERPCDSNMNLKCFFENGEICGFMSETLVSNHDNIEEISLNEFAHDFIKPLINANFQNKNQQKEFIKYLEDEIQSCEAVSDLLFNSNKEMKVYKEILQKHKEIIGVSNDY